MGDNHLDSTQILVQEFFTQTVQGEGHWAGRSADFIRLYGCPVGCPWCDTGYADGGAKLPRQAISIKEILSTLASPMVVVTGGEPFINPHLLELCQSLLSNERFVAIETSGIRWQEVSDREWITLSPKFHVTGKQVDKRFWERANEIKIVVEKLEDFEVYLPHLNTKTLVFVQPCDKGISLQESVKPCLDVIKKYPWVRLSLQTHKLIGVQ